MRWLISALLLWIPAIAQIDVSDSPRGSELLLSSTWARGYHALWINPANLGIIPRTVTFSLGSPMEYGEYLVQRPWSIGAGEIAASFASDALSLGELATMVLRFNEQRFTLEDKQRAARNFAGRGLEFNIDALHLGVAYQSSSWGGVGISVRDRISASLHMNAMLARILFLGRLDPYFDSTAVNWRGDTVGYARSPRYYSELFDSSRIAATWLREHAVGYGVQLYSTAALNVRSGVTVRLIEGYMLLDGRVERRHFQAYSALSPLFQINYGKATTPSFRGGSGIVPVGSGWGADVGIACDIADRLKIAVSVLDIGSVFWDGNVYAALDTVLNGLITTGFSSYNVVAEAQSITGEGGYFKWAGLRSVRTLLPMRMHWGISYALGPERDIGMEVIAPLRIEVPGASPLLVRLGTRYTVVPWFTFGAGLQVGGLARWMLPVALEFSLFDGRWQMVVSTQDLASYILAKPSVLSLAGAVLRFHL